MELEAGPAWPTNKRCRNTQVDQGVAESLTQINFGSGTLDSVCTKSNHSDCVDQSAIFVMIWDAKGCFWVHYPSLVCSPYLGKFQGYIPMLGLQLVELANHGLDNTHIRVYGRGYTMDQATLSPNLWLERIKTRSLVNWPSKLLFLLRLYW